MTASRTAAEARGARNQSTSSPLVVDRGLQVRSEQRPEVLGPDAVPQMGAEERVSDLRAEASLPEPLVLPFQGSAQNRANLYAKPFASHETAVELVLAVEEDVVPPSAVGSRKLNS